MVGKGLESLIPKKDQNTGKNTEPAKEFVFWIEIDKIKPNPFQPRKEFNEQELNSLADSIKKYGLLQPIIVTKIEKRTSSGGMIAEYQIIAGERRWRASRKAGLKQIPVIIKERSNQEKLEIALIENIQRKNLNIVDKAEAFERLRKEFSLLDKEIAEIVGMSREAVSNAFRILSLSDEIKNALKEEKISEGHARALLGVKDEKERKKLFLDLLENNYSVREVERKAKGNNVSNIDKTIINKEFLEKKLEELFSFDKVKLEKKKDKIQLVIDFDTEEDVKKWMKKIIHKD
ncbi:MAG: ParB/RepB/Spo0J family partition protein [Candidatus Microsyncoccus archaeolyticus]|jgi:ParB family chromosome partitioning protein|nr:MAG: ParB/RepB/Spo0J family partition protein [Candidatus Parcubacteria bacterium]